MHPSSFLDERRDQKKPKHQCICSGKDAKLTNELLGRFHVFGSDKSNQSLLSLRGRTNAPFEGTADVLFNSQTALTVKILHLGDYACNLGGEAFSQLPFRSG